MSKREMWDADRPVTVEMVAAELGVDLESYELRLDSVDHEHVAMGSSASLTGTHNADADVWRVITPETQRVEALKRERAELLARVHDIDVQLGKLDTGLHHDDSEAVA